MAIDKGKLRELLETTKEIQKNAYAPYSKFKVGAALLDSSGNVHVGCNVENSSYGATICAERNAIAAMVSTGAKKFTDILITTDTPNGCPPCGMCRQVLAEFSGDLKSTMVHVANLSGVVKTYSLNDLLPIAFDGTFLSP